MLLVTGITGHTGGYFLQELIKNKYADPIRAIVRETSNTSLIDNSGLNIEKVIGDLNDQKFIDCVMQGVDTILHIYNIHHSYNIVKAAIRNKVKRVILIHTTGIYSTFKAASKEYLLVEQKIEKLRKDSNCKIGITILRPSMIYGDLCDRNMSKFIKMIDRFRVMPVINGGRNLIQPVNARDLGKAYFSVLMNPEKTTGKNYDLTGKKPIKMIDAFKLISKELNKKTIFISIPLEIGVLISKVLKILSMGKVDIVEKVQRMGEDRSYSHEQASSDFGYSPMDFETGIRIEVQQYLNSTKN